MTMLSVLEVKEAASFSYLRSLSVMKPQMMVKLTISTSCFVILIPVDILLQVFFAVLPRYGHSFISEL